jgi:hypothetical protein
MYLIGSHQVLQIFYGAVEPPPVSRVAVFAQFIHRSLEMPPLMSVYRVARRSAS